MRTAVVFVACLSTAGPLFAQAPAGPEFLVNTYTTGRQAGGSVSADASSGFTVTWQQMDAPLGISAQRHAPDGTRLGGEFQVAAAGILPVVATARSGRDFFAWQNFDPVSQSDVWGRRFRDGAASGGVFRVNSYTSGTQEGPDIAPLPGGGAVVTWPTSFSASVGARAQRFDAFGLPRGPEITVNGTYATQVAVAADARGAFVMAWHDFPATCCRIAARLFHPDGTPVGPPFVVAPVSGYSFPDVSMAADGSFLVVWDTLGGDGEGYGIRGRRYAPDGAPIGTEFVVNEGTTGNQRFPMAAMDRGGEFVAAWSTGVGPSSYEVMARRFHATGAPRSGDFAVNGYTTGDQYNQGLATDGTGNFVVTWTSHDGNGTGVFARRFGGLLPAALAVDSPAGPASDGNGVLEPGETVGVVPSWRNATGVAQVFTAVLSSFGGPAGPLYSLHDPFGSYGAVPDGQTTPCVNCYTVGVSAPGGRPSVHWDAAAREEIAPDVQGQKKTWLLHVGESFRDVPRASPYYRFVETMLHHGVSGGCAAEDYCPSPAVSREQMAVFVLAARDPGGDPPPACGTPVFDDVPATSPYCRWIEELARAGVVGGCGGGSFCPQLPVTREQMAVFALRTAEPTLSPPPCGVPMFADVPASSPYCRWIEELARRGVVTGCGGGNYCPADPVPREQMAVFIALTFGLELYGP